MQTVPIVILLFLVVLAFALCGYLFVTLKKELQSLDRKRQAETAKSETQIEALRIEIGELRKDLDSLPEPAAIGAPPPALNLNRRTQALRMLRHGEGSEHIATTLSLPRKEVELLVKVQKMLIDPPADLTS